MSFNNLLSITVQGTDVLKNKYSEKSLKLVLWHCDFTVLHQLFLIKLKLPFGKHNYICFKKCIAFT